MIYRANGTDLVFVAGRAREAEVNDVADATVNEAVATFDAMLPITTYAYHA